VAIAQVVASFPLPAPAGVTTVFENITKPRTYEVPHFTANQMCDYALKVYEAEHTRAEQLAAELEAAKRAMDLEAGLAKSAESRAEQLATENAVCREAIESCYDFVQGLDCDSDYDAASQRVTLRMLNEAVGKAAPRLLMERPEGQKLYGLAWAELRARAERAEAALRDAAYALFQIKRMVPEAVRDFAAEAHAKACKVVDNE
jgi:hypothetical protein